MRQTEQYLRFLEHGRMLSHNTVKSIEHDFTVFGDTIETAVRGDVENFVMDQNMNKLSTGTIARRISSLKGFFDWQIYNGYRTGINPAGGKMAPKIKNESHQAITRNELDYLYNNAPNDNIKVAIGLMGYAGMRIGEVVELGSTNHIYYDENGILAIDLKETKGGYERKVTLGLIPNTNLVEMVQAQGGLLGQRGILSSNGLWRQMSKYFKDMGHEDFSPHGLRATFATVSTQSHVRVDVVRDVLGHTTLSGNAITSRYVSVTSVENQYEELRKGWC